MLYRILTENKNYSGVVDIVNGYFESFTVVKAEGYWQGQSEHSLIIEVCSEDKNGVGIVRAIAYKIKKLNKQQAVLVQEIACDSYLV